MFKPGERRGVSPPRIVGFRSAKARPFAERKATIRRAFTIIEMLLVMAVIVMAAAIVVSNIDGVRNAYRLPRAADDLRGILAGLRARAMDEATMFEFSFTPETSRFHVSRAGETSDRANVALSDVDVDASDRAEFNTDDVLGDHELAAGLTLKQDDRGSGMRRTPSNADGEESQKLTLRFMPDGSCTGLAFVLKDETGSQMDVQVRALTGAVKMIRKNSEGKEITP